MASKIVRLSDGTNALYTEMAVKTGAFTPVDGVTANDVRVIQVGNIVQISMFLNLNTALPSSETALGTISGIKHPVKTERYLCGGGNTAYTADTPVYVLINSSGEIKASTRQSTSVKTIDVEIMYIANSFS